MSAGAAPTGPVAVHFTAILFLPFHVNLRG